ncbi:MAG: 3-dehydroquinate synthase, partial [Candidatus Promineifilaceae bacterium]
LNQLLLSAIVGKSVEVKRNIVENDPYEKGQRAWLNLGHTFGHAIERVSRYEIRHGEAVAMGLVAACHLSAELGACSPSLERRVAEALAGVELPTQIPPRLGAESIYDAMWSDKKKLTGSLRFVLPHEIGDVFITNEPQAEQVIATLRHCGAGPM